MTVNECARILRTSPTVIRVGLQKGVFDFGWAVKMPSGRRYEYVIIDEKVRRLFGTEASEVCK